MKTETVSSMKVPKTMLEPGSGILPLPFEFRWPVEQTGESTVIVKCPIGKEPLLSVSMNPIADKMLNLSAAEHDRAVEDAQAAAFHAAILSLAIIRRS